LFSAAFGHAGEIVPIVTIVVEFVFAVEIILSKQEVISQKNSRFSDRILGRRFFQTSERLEENRYQIFKVSPLLINYIN
jgi:hypothetical protein